MNYTLLPTITMLLLAFLWTYGIITAFSSHVITGIIVLLLEPLPIVIGISQIFGYNIADSITDFILKLVS